jgi:ADP-ribose pyrophosphatase
LRVEQVSLPDGSVLERGAIEHPGSVVLVPIKRSSHGPEVLMLRQLRFALARPILELPAGTREWDEEWLSAAQRELREETGHRAESFTPLGEVWPAPGITDELMKLYLASGLSPDPLQADQDEEIEVQLLPLDDLAAMAQDGRLQDGKSIIGIMRAAAYLGISVR